MSGCVLLVRNTKLIVPPVTGNAALEAAASLLEGLFLGEGEL